MIEEKQAKQMSCNSVQSVVFIKIVSVTEVEGTDVEKKQQRC